MAFFREKNKYLERKYNFEDDLMKALPTILWEMPSDYIGTDQLAVYDMEDQIIHMNSWQYEILMDSKLLFLRIIIHDACMQFFRHGSFSAVFLTKIP